MLRLFVVLPIGTFGDISFFIDLSESSSFDGISGIVGLGTSFIGFIIGFGCGVSGL